MISFRDRPSPNFDSRPDGAPIDMLVFHYTGMRTAAEALDRLTDPEARVSAHYVVEEDGTVWRLVDEKRGPGMPGFPPGAARPTSTAAPWGSNWSIPVMNSATARFPTRRWKP